MNQKLIWSLTGNFISKSEAPFIHASCTVATLAHLGQGFLAYPQPVEYFILPVDPCLPGTQTNSRPLHSGCFARKSATQLEQLVHSITTLPFFSHAEVECVQRPLFCSHALIHMKYKCFKLLPFLFANCFIFPTGLKHVLPFLHPLFSTMHGMPLV